MVSAASDVAQILDAVCEYVRRYVVMSDAESVAVGLHAFHTHVLDAADTTPYISVTSAEMESGKTLLLETLELVVARPWLTGRVTAAVLARKVDKEADASPGRIRRGLQGRPRIRGDAARHPQHRLPQERQVVGLLGQGANIGYADLSTFCPKVIAGIGDLPGTVASRSIPIRLKRRAPDERVERWWRRDVQEVAEPLYQALASLGEYSVDRLAEARPGPAARAPRPRRGRVGTPARDRRPCGWRVAGTGPVRRRRSWAAARPTTRRSVCNSSPTVGLRLAGETASPPRNCASFSWRMRRGRGRPGITARPSRRERSRACCIGSRFARGRFAWTTERPPKGYMRESFEDARKRYLSAHPRFIRHNATSRIRAGIWYCLLSATQPPVWRISNIPQTRMQTTMWRISRVSPRMRGNERPRLGDPMFPALLSKAHRDGHIDDDELAERFALHKFVVRGGAS